jgi:hypothetical protein
MNKQNVTIGLLSATAVLLMVAVIFIGQADQAVAGNSESRGGDYVAVSLGVRADREVQVVIDNSVERLNVYGLNDTGSGVELGAPLIIPLDQYFDAARGGVAPVPPPR